MLPTGSRPSPSGVYFDKLNNVLVVAGSPTEKGRISVWMNRQLYRFWSATNPYDVWVSNQSLIYSAEWDHISVYNYNGSIVSRIPTDYGVVGITGDNKGFVFVTYYYSAKVDAYLVANGLKVGTYKFPLQDTPAQPYSGHHFDLVYDPQGYLFVTNRSKHSVSRLKIQGSQLVTASISAANKTYDGTTGATTTCTLVGVAVGDTVTCSATNANFADANVGNSKTVTATGIILAGSSMAKYTLTNTTASTKANITPAAATVRLSNLTQTFTGKALTPIATTTPSGLSVTWVGAPQTNAGTYPVSATVNNPNYQQSSASGTFIISKATQPTLTLTATPSTIISGSTGATLSVSGGIGGNVTYAAVGTSGVTCTVSGNVVTATGTVAGTCTITATNPGNANYLPAKSTPAIITVILKPDFIITGVTLSPTSPAADGTFSAVVMVKNQGFAPGDGGFLDVWSNNSSIQACGADGNANVGVGRLSPGESKSFTLTGLRAGSQGTKTFRAFVNSNCTSSESNDTNNQFALAYAVGTSKSRPNFIISSITINPTTLKVGNTFSATVIVRNSGLTSADGGYIDLWTNAASSQVCGVAGNSWTSVGILAAGTTRSITFTGLRAASTGAKTLRAFVDSECVIPETSDADNQRTLNYTVSP